MGTTAKRGVVPRVGTAGQAKVRKSLRTGGMPNKNRTQQEERYWASLNGPVTVRKINTESNSNA